MQKHILFIHGGDVNGYNADTHLATSLRKELGTGFSVHMPKMPNDEKQWLNQIASEMSSLNREVILTGHSLGASMLLKYLSEYRINKDIRGIFLIAPPFWSGNENWVQPLKLQKDFAEKLPKEIPMFFYQCRDDEVVPYDHFTIYKQHIPWAVFHETATGGHQFNNDLAIVASDIRKL
jgi:hypothetical protein